MALLLIWSAALTAALILTALLTVPIKLGIGFYIAQDRAGVGAVFFLFGGAVKLRFAENVKTDNERGLIYSNKKSKKYGQNVLWSLVNRKKKRKKGRLALILKSALASAAVCRIGINGVIGVKDAADKTVIALGTIRSLAYAVFSRLPDAVKRLELEPDFDNSVLRLEASCILNIDLGKFIIEAIKNKRR